MTYETVVAELFSRRPQLETAYRTKLSYMTGEEPLPYLVFGSILIPALTSALEEGRLGVILPICAFLEDASIDARKHNGLLGLIRIEVGEWLGWVAHEERLAPWLGPETKRICKYVPGLATQRLELRAAAKAKSLPARIAAVIRRLRSR